MKKITLLVLLVLVAALLTASYPVPGPISPPSQRLSGTLLFSRNNVCMIRDYIALPVMENVYLQGKGFPTVGQFQGCWIEATGNYISIGTCRVFQVSSSRVLCPNEQPSLQTNH